MELLRMVIVDDERILLQGLVETYEWNKVGFEVVGFADSGERAIEVIKETKPHLVLSDIRMKKINGLMVMEEIKKILPDTMFIFISAHRDFEYAQKACDMGAYTYLLKPIEDEKLMSTVKSAYDKCIKSIEDAQERDNLKKFIDENEDIFVRTVIRKYLENNTSEDKVIEVLSMIGMETSSNTYFVTVCVNQDISMKIVNDTDYYAEERMICAGIIELFEKSYVIFNFKGSDDRWYYVLMSDMRIDVYNIKAMIDELKKKHTGVISAISKEYTGIVGMKKSYDEVVELYEAASRQTVNSFASNISIRKPNGEKEYSIDNERAVINAIRKNDGVRFKEEYIRFICELPEEEKKQKQFLHMLMLQTEMMLKDSYGYTKAIEDSINNFYGNYTNLSAAKIVDVCHKLFQNILSERESVAVDENQGYFGEYIENAISYINDNLNDEELSIVSVATHVCLNPVYFGRVFKKITGVTFRKYLMKQRMELAKKLIQDDESSIAYICERVGISNPSYFSHVFKQYTGTLPTEYRNTSNGIQEYF